MIRQGIKRERMEAGNMQEKCGSNQYAMEIESLTKTYGKKRGVRNISFAVEEGDIFGFLGPNGA